MHKYRVDFKRLSLMLLPVGMRRPRFAAVAKAIVMPLSALHISFMNFRADSIYRLTHNGQVCHLEAVLNDMFDPTSRRIMIDDPETGDQRNVTFYTRDQNRAIVFPNRSNGSAVIFNRRGFGGINDIDFLVKVPSKLADSLDTDRMRTIINMYKLASKRYSIIFV